VIKLLKEGADAMVGHSPESAVFIVGMVAVVLGGCVVWLIMRRERSSAVRQATNLGQVEIVRLNEKLSGMAAELARYRDKAAESENNAVDLGNQLNSSRNDCTRFEERAARVPTIESELVKSATENQDLAQVLADTREKLAISNSVADGQRGQLGLSENEVADLRGKCDELLSEQERLKTRLAESVIILDAERSQTAEKLNLINEAKEHLTDRFQALASDILEDKAKRFTELNQNNIREILDPLKEKLHEFRDRVERVHTEDIGDRTALREQVKQVLNLNQQLSQDANNLARALKGSSKAQGNWGEVILERILELSGLRNGDEYDVKESCFRPDGTRAQPDVVIHLPNGRQLIVDSKVSLTAYGEYSAAENAVALPDIIERHVASVRGHVKDLSQRDYHLLYGVKSIDFVVMFVPIEPAFAVAIEHDNNILEDAWRGNILLVSPTTLFFVIRTVAHLWRQESQNRNVKEIAEMGASLYDKLCGFVDDLQEIGKRLDQARASYDSAYAKLSTGRGNVIKQAESLRALGVKPSKALPLDLLETALDDSLLLPDIASAEITKPEAN
jgi:DNA recombination protein RmuC